MRRIAAGATGLVTGLVLVAMPGVAHAAPGEMGNGCVANGQDPGTTTLMTAKAASNPLPVTALTTGVITKARFAMPPEAPGTYPHKVKVVRPAAGSNKYTVMAESAFVSVTTGTNTYDVRVPIAAGDLIGVYGSAGTFYCVAPADNIVAKLSGDATVGDTDTYSPLDSTAIPLVATVEPDVDKDGYGDVTQDQCPQSAAVQVECPVVVLDSFGIPQGRKILVLVGTNTQAQVTVTGTAKVGGKTVKLSSKPKSVSPGSFGRITVKLPKALRDALAGLPSTRSIKVKLVASSTDVAGRKSTDKSSVRLPGTR
jgi:hypothetical protein